MSKKILIYLSIGLSFLAYSPHSVAADSWIKKTSTWVTPPSSSTFANSFLPSRTGNINHSQLKSIFEGLPRRERSDFYLGLTNTVAKNADLMNRLRGQGEHKFLEFVQLIAQVEPANRNPLLRQIDELVRLPEIREQVLLNPNISNSFVFYSLAQIARTLAKSSMPPASPEQFRELFVLVNNEMLLPDVAQAFVRVMPDDQDAFRSQLGRFIEMMATEQGDEPIGLPPSLLMAVASIDATDRVLFEGLVTQLAEYITSRWSLFETIKGLARIAPNQRAYITGEICAYLARIRPEFGERAIRLILENSNNQGQWHRLMVEFIRRNGQRQVVPGQVREDLQRLARAGVDVHAAGRDDRTENSLRFFLTAMQNFTIHIQLELLGLKSYLDHAFIPSQADKAQARETQQKAIRVLWGPRETPFDFGAALDPGSTYYGRPGSEVIAKLWYFARTFNRRDGYQNPSVRDTNVNQQLKVKMVQALANAIEDDGHRVCNPGQLQRLLTYVVQGYIRGVEVDEKVFGKEELTTVIRESFSKFMEDNKTLNSKEALRTASEEHLKLTYGFDGPTLAQYQAGFRAELEAYIRLTFD